MKNIIDIYEASLLGDIEDTIKNGDDFSNLHNWIENFKNLSSMSANISNFVDEIKNNGGKIVKSDDIKSGEYYVNVENKNDKQIFGKTLLFYYPDEKEDNVWRYAIIHLQLPQSKLQEKRGVKREARFYNSKVYKVSLSYLQQLTSRSNKNRKMYSLPYKFKDIIKLIDMEENKQ